MKTILGIDPGREKFGLAVVRGDSKQAEILWRGVFSFDELRKQLEHLRNQYEFDFAVVGDGTNSRTAQELLRETMPSIAILILDEKDTSIRAREKYWEVTPRRGWRRFIPSSLQVPPVPIDDFVAVILAERALSVE